MTNPRLLKFITDLTPQKQVTVLLICAVVTLCSVIKVLVTQGNNDRKTASVNEVRKLESDNLLLRARVNRLEFEKDSLMAKSVFEKDQTITLLREIFSKQETIMEKIKTSK